MIYYQMTPSYSSPSADEANFFKQQLIALASRFAVHGFVELVFVPGMRHRMLDRRTSLFSRACTSGIEVSRRTKNSDAVLSSREISKMMSSNFRSGLVRVLEGHFLHPCRA